MTGAVNVTSIALECGHYRTEMGTPQTWRRRLAKVAGSAPLAAFCETCEAFREVRSLEAK